jgi:hypothetical protein
MTPVQLYADILLHDEVMHGRPATEATKEASLAERIGGKSGNSGKRGRHGRNKGRQYRASHSQSYDGFVYDGRQPSEEYVRSQRDKKGANYRECQFCTWPGHVANDCRKLKALKAKQGSKHQATSQKSNDSFAPTTSGTSGKFITWEASITELVAGAIEMQSEHIWGLDSHANIHLTPYRHRFIDYRELDRPEHVAGWHGGVETVIGIRSINLVGKSGCRY